MSILFGAEGAKNVKEIYVGVDGAPRKVKEGYVGVGGQPKRFYSSGPSLPPMGTPLDKCTWEQIRMIAGAGLAAQYFKVGETKAVYLRGTVSQLTLDTTLYVYILGFDHNGDKNTIDFGTFKDAGGKDIFLRSGFDDDSDFYMSPAADAGSGGWKSSYMRYSILGSTKSQNDDAGEDTATDPVPNTLMSCLPSDLRAVMRPMTIYTDNVGGEATDASSVTATVDYLPFLAEYEVYGWNSTANPNEPARQAQYEYFKEGDTSDERNSRARKWAFDGAELQEEGSWWMRSPGHELSGYFVVTRSSGYSSAAYAEYSQGVAPIFRV